MGKEVIMKKSNKTETDMKIFSDTMNQLIREKKIEFGFYNNKLIKLELLQICYDKSKDRWEIELTWTEKFTKTIYVFYIKC